MNSNHKISMFVLVLLITGAVDSVRNLPATALFGSTLIFFFIASSILFLIPTALVSAELASQWPQDEGGIHDWMQRAFGPKIAFLTIWLQWISTVVWYPSVLSFIAGTAAYLINPELAHHKGYLVGMILLVFWSLTLISLRGLKTSAHFAGICAIFGMLIPMGLIIILALIWVFAGHPVYITLTSHTLLPHFNHSESWISLIAIMTAFIGMELSAVHINHIQNPGKNFPKALFLSVVLILITMILGSLAIAFVLPQDKINLVDGVMQAFSNFLKVYDLNWMLPILAVMLLVGSLGGLINWLIAPAKGMLMTVDNGYLPPFFAHKNKYGVAYRLLIAQALIVTALCCVFLLIPSINGVYWFFTNLSTELYMLMYMLLFLGALRLKQKYPTLKSPFMIPGGKYGSILVCMSGLLGCIITLFVGFIPPNSTIEVGNIFRYEFMFSSGMVFMLLPVVFFYRYRVRNTTISVK